LPLWQYDLPTLTGPLAAVSRAQGLLVGRLADVGPALRSQACLAALTADVVRSSEIDGEVLAGDAVQSSLARRLGLDGTAPGPVDRRVDGPVEMLLDATTRAAEPLTVERLQGWHGAPAAPAWTAELQRFIDWANAEGSDPPLVKAGIAQLWFMTLHPFQHGNGRTARAVGDLFLARADGSPQRFYSLSAQIQRERSEYYDILGQTQHGIGDVTPWLLWYLDALGWALGRAQSAADHVLAKSRLWQRWASTPMNARQVKLLNRLLDGTDGRITSSIWGRVAGCSPDTALRDITELMALGVLEKLPGGGRSTGYRLTD
jgi:Fic family protein